VEPLQVVFGDRHDVAQVFQRPGEVADLVRGDLEAVGRVVVGQQHPLRS